MAEPTRPDKSPGVPTSDANAHMRRWLGKKPVNSLEAIRAEAAKTRETMFPTAKPEDEFVKDVEAVSVFGKFSNGVVLNEKRLIPGNGKQVFQEMSPQGMHLWGQIHTFDGINNMLTASISNTASVNKIIATHFLSEVPFDSKETEFHAFNKNPKFKNGYSLVVYSFFNPETDIGGRLVGFSSVSFLMKEDKAGEFIQLVANEEHGADIARRFLEKGAPGVLASDRNSSGIHALQAKDLVILDRQFLNQAPHAQSFQRGGAMQGGSGIAVLNNGNYLASNIDKAVHKRYASLVGTV